MKELLIFMGFALGAALGAVITLLILRLKQSSLAASLQTEKSLREQEKRLTDENLEAVKKDCESRISAAKQEAAKREIELKQECANRMDTLKNDDAQRLAKLEESYNKQLEIFKMQVAEMTNQTLVKQSESLQNNNEKQMESIFKPVKEEIEKMQRTINDNRDAHNRTTSSLETTIKLMVERTATLGKQADRLSNALQHKNKTAGNWGEMVLSELLEAQGLKKGIHFDVQQMMCNEMGVAQKNEESNKRMIPDVILHLSENREVIIDSKVSLTAFTDYCAAEDDEKRAEALKRHLNSIRDHVKELSGKNYAGYVAKPKETVDYVMMFVPIEGALQLAMAEDHTLWNEAFDKKVMIVGTQTLIAALRIIELTWVKIQQDRNTEKVMDQARKLVERVELFYREFLNVEKKMSDAQEAVKSVSDRVRNGNKSILGAGRALEELGVKGKKALPTVEDLS